MTRLDLDAAPLNTVASSARLPWSALLALATGGFITILTEALPAGVLVPMGKGLQVSSALVGQLVTFYALGSLLAAIPVVAMTRGWRRRPLLMLAVAGFAVSNIVTALSPVYYVTLLARFAAGVSAGILWSLLAGMASRMVTPELQGKAIAVAMLGTPLALALGLPAGAWLGAAVGWRWTFGIVSIMAALLLVWMRWAVADMAAAPVAKRRSVFSVLARAGVRQVLLTLILFVLAHNILYTYLEPLLQAAKIGKQLGAALLLFGGASLLGIWVAGTLVDRHLRQLVLLSTALFLSAMLGLVVAGAIPWVVYVAVGVWGVAFGGSATLFQTAAAKAATDEADAAQSMLVTAWNLAIAGGGLAGGIWLDWGGASTLPWLAVVLLVAGWYVAWNARSHGFPAS
ncbi:putative MFS family arabinose efflux permease [Luteibacter sp. Sphag1AF]|uniref:MFS transporter n=1 Tax=Luteibacter sp. Sphag1AF TaxID=2587031 RepID=UPI0016104740|nr:MFS transporter [Luteibacter sp. Sphag1AF]MBB3226538.1 putative MFS family arabinose efflux permease [Luteibacter sp. Sphag1AF]